MSVIRTVFLGTPEFAEYHLQQLIDDDHYVVVGVVTQPDRPSGRNMKLHPSPVKKLAESKNIPVITPENMKSPQTLALIQSWRAEAAVVVAFGQLLPQAFLDLFPSRVVNVHGSLLPRWRGAAPIQRAIMEGDKQTGVCLQVMVKKLDAGPVLGSYPIAITDSMSATELHDEMKVLGAKLLHVELMDYLRGHLTPVAQDESQVTYAHKLTKEEGEIDWRQPALQIQRKIRGMQMGPGCFTTLAGKRMKIISSTVLDRDREFGNSGKILEASATGLVVATGKGSLNITELQPESKPRMAVRDFLLGHKINSGDMLGNEDTP
jgi:methionyl-tRNA formyltransferase